MKSFRRLRFVPADQVKAGGITLRRLPLAIEGEQEPVGEIDGVVIDLRTRRVRYLVVRAHGSDQKCLPLDATCVDPHSGVLARVGADAVESCEPFDASRVGRFDDEAVMSLLFRQTAA